jgi:hypothetical protein
LSLPDLQTYLDEDVDVLIAELLRARGLKVTTTGEAGRVGSDDSGQLEFSVEHRLTLVTHNRAHFTELARHYAVAGKMHHGIILATRRSPYELARRILALARQVSATEIQNQVRYI